MFIVLFCLVSRYVVHSYKTDVFRDLFKSKNKTKVWKKCFKFLFKAGQHPTTGRLPEGLPQICLLYKQIKALRVSSYTFVFGTMTGKYLCWHKASCLEPFPYCSFGAIIVKTHLQYYALCISATKWKTTFTLLYRPFTCSCKNKSCCQTHFSSHFPSWLKWCHCVHRNSVHSN